MGERIKQSIFAGDDSTNLNAGRDINLIFEGYVPKEFVDEKIHEWVEKLRKSRFFPEFDTRGASLMLGTRLMKGGDLSGGSNGVRGPAMAWCARFLSRSENLDPAEKFLEQAKTLGIFSETKIAEAFIISQKGDGVAALSILAEIDTVEAHSASLMIVMHHENPEGALRWMDRTGYTVRDLDSDGKSFLLGHQLQQNYWNEASQTANSLSQKEYEDTPILHHWVALATLIPTVHQDLRTIVLSQVPFEAREFPLASDAGAIRARRAAHQHFLKAVDSAKQLACLRAAKVDDEYALWLELRDPEQSAHGKNRLESKLHDLGTGLGFVYYAFQFKIKFDPSLVEREIDRSIAINGKMTEDAAFARYTLAFTQPTAEAVANYIARYHNQLSPYIDARQLWYQQIEFLLRAGLTEKANDVLDQLRKEGISPEQESDLQRIISQVQGSNPIDSLKAQYETTKALGDLINLVAELEIHQCWDEVCEFGMQLFQKTHALSDAEALVNAFNKTHRSEAVVGFLRENNDLLTQSNHLCISYVWGLFNEGVFLECREMLSTYRHMLDDPNYHALQINLGIATGDWDSLSAFIADEHRNRNERSADDLLRAAQLALYLDLPQAKALVFEAASKAENDSTILANAYFIATAAGWENDPKVDKWLEKAIELSGEDGPLQKMSLKEFFDRKPEWDRRESETWRMLAQGQIPIFVAAQSLNRTLIDLTTFPSYTNLMEIDPRRRITIPAYSGKRMPRGVDVGGKVAALDVTAMLTLSFLNLLDMALDAFDAVYIPHTTLEWLFKERQKVSFHQPNRILNAHKIRNLLAKSFLEKFTPTTTANSDLSLIVGDNLAALIAEAESKREGDERQRIVVRSAPVHRLSSFMAEEADLSAHKDVLSSCLAVVEKLKQKAQLTADEERRARNYLQIQEKRWPNQPVIVDGATLYLDDIAVTHFLHLGFLDKFEPAGLKAVISPSVISETDALISYEGISKDVKTVIESIRASLNLRIQSGHVKVGSRRNHDKVEEEFFSEHPSVSIFTLAHLCDIAIIDDRSINQHANIDSGSALMPVSSTLDLLEAFVASRRLSHNDWLEYRTRLRRAGYFFIPVNSDELEECMKASTVEKGKVVETAELKAIREYVLRIRMSDLLQIPEEMSWLVETLKAYVRVLRNLWVDDTDIEGIIARSNWLVDQLDIRGWAQNLIPENADNVVRIGYAEHILLLLMPPTRVKQSVIDAYWKWVEDRILTPMQEEFPTVYKWLVDWYRSHMAGWASPSIQEEATRDQHS